MWLQNRKAQERIGGSQASSEEKQQEGEEEKEEGEDKKEEEETDEDERLLKEFEEEMGDLTVPPSKIIQIKKEMQKEFDNIIEEVPRPSCSSTPSSLKTYSE